MRLKVISVAALAAFLAIPVAVKFGARKPSREADIASVQELVIRVPSHY